MNKEILPVNALEAWLEGRPQVVKDMARKYPPGARFKIHGKVVWVIAYNEDGGLCVTETDPRENYDCAVFTREPLCACCSGQLDALRLQ